MWFVTPSGQTSPADEWIELVTEFRKDLRAELVGGTPEDWLEISVTDADDSWWFTFERYSVATNGDRWASDLDFFHSWLVGAKPEVNARWVEEYLGRVRMVYMFRCSTSAPDTNLDLVNEIVQSLRDDDPSGLLYAELEGWSNEDGKHITWAFSDRVTGEWWMAVRRPNRWVYFRMDLGNPEHRRAFQAGEVPTGVEAKEFAD
jgi:hypothetical protein